MAFPSSEGIGSVGDWRTFEEWSADGYRIVKGSKSQRRNEDGVPLFHLEQVWDPLEECGWEDMY